MFASQHHLSPESSLQGYFPRSSELEKRLSLPLVKPDEGKLTQLGEMLHRAQSLVFGISHNVTVPSSEVAFLAEPLTPNQKNELNNYYLTMHTRPLLDLIAISKKVEIVESGQPMVALDRGITRLGLDVAFSTLPFHEACGSFAGKPRLFWAREGVAELFYNAVRVFNELKITPVVQDSFRPLEVQEGIFRRRIDWIKQNSPERSHNSILDEARITTASSPRLAAHMSGAAIDFTLTDRYGEPLPLGNAYPEGGASSSLRFPYLTTDEFVTRTLFSEVCRMCGFTPYPGEDWHVSSNDVFARIIQGRSNQPATYGPIRDFNRKTGAIEPLAGGSQDQEFGVSNP